MHGETPTQPQANGVGHGAPSSGTGTTGGSPAGASLASRISGMSPDSAAASVGPNGHPVFPVIPVYVPGWEVTCRTCMWCREEDLHCDRVVQRKTRPQDAPKLEDESLVCLWFHRIIGTRAEADNLLNWASIGDAATYAKIKHLEQYSLRCPGKFRSEGIVRVLSQQESVKHDYSVVTTGALAPSKKQAKREASAVRAATPVHPTTPTNAAHTTTVDLGTGDNATSNNGNATDVKPGEVMDARDDTNEDDTDMSGVSVPAVPSFLGELCPPPEAAEGEDTASNGPLELGLHSPIAHIVENYESIQTSDWERGLCNTSGEFPTKEYDTPLREGLCAGWTMQHLAPQNDANGIIWEDYTLTLMSVENLFSVYVAQGDYVYAKRPIENFNFSAEDFTFSHAAVWLYTHGIHPDSEDANILTRYTRARRNRLLRVPWKAITFGPTRGDLISSYPRHPAGNIVRTDTDSAAPEVDWGSKLDDLDKMYATGT
ncbi:hypothetical protein C8R43DRAFT_948460 [Mycena crocata]|nr:hypothetical protein C8R43DRAFT_948460 [Mycena crocata]